MKKATATNVEKNANVNLSSLVPKNFRQQADIESFYRFVYENDLRIEAVEIMQDVRTQKRALKAAKAKVKH